MLLNECLLSDLIVFLNNSMKLSKSKRYIGFILNKSCNKIYIVVAFLDKSLYISLLFSISLLCSNDLFKISSLFILLAFDSSKETINF